MLNMLGSKALWRSGFPYHRWEVTTSVSAGPGQAADNVEHLELELWRRRGEKKQKHGYGVVLHVSVIHPPQRPEDTQKNSRECGTAESHQPRGERLTLQPCWWIHMWRHVKCTHFTVCLDYLQPLCIFSPKNFKLITKCSKCCGLCSVHSVLIKVCSVFKLNVQQLIRILLTAVLRLSPLADTPQVSISKSYIVIKSTRFSENWDSDNFW